MIERTGSYPFMDIARDYGVPYEAVLQYAEHVRRHITGRPFYDYLVWAEKAAHAIASNVRLESSSAIFLSIANAVQVHQEKLGNL